MARGDLPDPLPEFLEAAARAAIDAVEWGDLAEARRAWDLGVTPPSADASILSLARQNGERLSARRESHAHVRLFEDPH